MNDPQTNAVSGQGSEAADGHAQVTMPVYFVTHGGGPWPWVPQWLPWHAQLAQSLRAMPAQIGQRPRAVLLISAHWEEAEFTVQTAARPGMLYDYSGFPADTYAVQYPAVGDPELASQVAALLQGAAMVCAQDGQRGFDHGAFVPLHLIYPQADVPVVQLSLRASLNAGEHLALGRILAPLRKQGVLILGSGASYHNMRTFGPAGHAPSKLFDDWLARTLMGLPAAQRSQQLAEWTRAPAARIAHPREEHLLPLMVAVGAAGEDVAQRVFHQHGFMDSATVSSYRLG